MLLVLIAVGSRLKQRPHTWHWAGLAAIFALLSLDEATGIHELSTGPLRELLGPSAPMYYAWVIPAFLCLVPFGLVYSKFVFLQEEGTRNLFVIAGAVYLAGALGVEMIGGSYRSGYGLDLTYGIIATVEEMFEMTGIVIFSYALMDHIERDSLELRLLFHMERCSNEEPVHVPTIESGRERASSAEVTDRLGTES